MAIYPLNMVMFHSYVSLPEANYNQLDDDYLVCKAYCLLGDDYLVCEAFPKCNEFYAEFLSTMSPLVLFLKTGESQLRGTTSTGQV